ncbi:uncharacterized protein LOC123533748 [Mercenaria mercenaria]|uniref:uncharacterized protein LOC123533748 n=1 Tax=Mercenaria mercenaria TaxID=6596 RepID=UPI00234F11FA|nr:uncharacterized protein LOC123533748 [Mercenaria mercenaria]XP_053376228.1 uncharacterized protein LOC123533748 [Mercenaria mercenaria]XP_053376229.1 uncharacterized protein LOC123533748 [Mercenaria mercenaria]XP_053376230.1 uncharacterized protein LOC123533748 [Mercenaria mercenaria]
MDLTDETMQNRKISTATVTTDSGVSSICNEGSVCEEEMADITTAGEDITDAKPKVRLSMDEHEQRNIDLGKFMEATTVRSRRSCSLPDILDFDNIEFYDDDPNNSTDFPQSSANSSKDSLSVVTTDTRKTSTTSLGSFQLCGKEHVEKPCYICLKDNEIYCSVCVQVHNFHCKENVKHIPEIPPEMRTSLCGEAMKELRVVRERFNKVKAENENYIEQLKDSRRTFLRSVMKYKNTIIEAIDKLEKEALSQMDAVYNREKNKIEQNLNQLEREIADIESYITILEQCMTANENSVVYELQGATEQLRIDEAMVRDLHKSTSIVQFEFEPSADMLATLTNFEKLWKVTKKETVACTYPRPCSCDRSYRNKVAVKEKEVSVRLSGLSFDRERCCITGCEFLPNGKLLACDNGNKKVKLFDKKFKCISAHTLHSLPWDVAVIDAERAVVTIPDRKQLHFIGLHHRISMKETVTLEQNCWGVSYSNEQIFVTCWSRDIKEVIILDTNGTPKRRIVTVQSQPFHTPWFIDGHDDTMFVSDWGTYLVQGVTTSGIPLSKYRKSNLVGPLGMCRDPDENVFICGRDSNNIHQISKDGTEQRVFLSERDGIQQPLNLCLRASDDKLIVTSWMSDKLTVFRLQ